MTAKRSDVEGPAKLRARLPVAAPAALRSARSTYSNRAQTFGTMVKWPALEASFLADVAAIDAEIKRRAA
jgi:hypothetical protein